MILALVVDAWAIGYAECEVETNERVENGFEFIASEVRIRIIKCPEDGNKIKRVCIYMAQSAFRGRRARCSSDKTNW